MSIDHSAYLVYGVPVPEDRYHVGTFADTESGWVDAVIKHTPGLDSERLGHLTAGDYDENHLFLTYDLPGWEGKSAEVELGSYVVLGIGSFSPDAHLANEQLRLLAEAAQYGVLDEPGWIVVPDAS